VTYFERVETFLRRKVEESTTAADQAKAQFLKTFEERPCAAIESYADEMAQLPMAASVFTVALQTLTAEKGGLDALRRFLRQQVRSTLHTVRAGCSTNPFSNALEAAREEGRWRAAVEIEDWFEYHPQEAE